jgi:hypothetical protein
MAKKNHDEGGELHFEQISHHGVRYESRDMGIRGIIAFLVILGISGIVLCLVVWGYYDYRAKHLAAEPPVTGRPMLADTLPTQPDPTKRFPAPVLQPNDVADMNKFLANEQLRLYSYGWVDRNAGIVHIPIDEAMKIIAKQGLPTRPAPPPSTVAQFGSGADTVAGMAGGTRPVLRK